MICSLMFLDRRAVVSMHVGRYGAKKVDKVNSGAASRV